MTTAPLETMEPGLQLSDYYTPHAGQEELHAVQAKVKVLHVARRWGKGRFSLFEMLSRYIESLSIPVGRDLVPPFHAWVVVPSFPQGRQAWNEIAALLPRELVRPEDIHADEWIVYLRGNQDRPWGLIELKSAHNPEALQTVGLDFLWVQEAQDISELAFQKLLPTLRSPNRMSYAVFEGIPALYSDHWFQKMFDAAKRGKKGYHAYKATVYENPLLPKEQREDVEGDRELLPEKAWKRMYLAEFSESAGYFTNIDECTQGTILPEPLFGARYVAGLDFGRKVDNTVFDIFDAVHRKMVHHRSWDAGSSWVMIKEGIKFYTEQWSLEKVVADATALGGDVLCSELTEDGVPIEEFVLTYGSRDKLLTQLQVSLEKHSISFPDVPAMQRQLRAFQARKQPSGGYKVEAPPGEHDDEVFALALGLYGCDSAENQFAGGASTNYRYVQTQAEANGGVSPRIGRMLEHRQSEKMRQRMERAGVEV